MLQERKAGSKINGRVTLEHYELRKVHTFLDYISSGTQLNCTFAIDFTCKLITLVNIFVNSLRVDPLFFHSASNGDPNLPESLHYISELYPNQYEQALRAVGDIIQDYDSDKMYPVLGFGARLPPDGRISHEFFVNMNPTNPFVQGIDGET
jgi:hypothetical protein